MKLECSIIKDLLPLYVEQLASEASCRAIEEHLKECEECRTAYLNMKTPELHIQYDRTPAESLKKYVTKKKWRLGIKVAAATAAVVFLIVFIRLALIGSLVGFLALDSMNARVYEDTDVNHYLRYMGNGAQEEYADKWGMDESIFPKEISEEMNVTDYKMVYYNPWDAQYLSYLVVEYQEEEYQAEEKRLKSYASTEYAGYYGAEGFAESYELLAMEADPYYGFVYALKAEGRKIIYVELIFCNYFMDLEYDEIIPKEYLPVGFDATENNFYRKRQLGKEFH
ncbi:MAG: zf-HC2 domain-containing protein [Eubacteriales bacterium]|nr:zf-HC2 domain-containing protein [Eubacteriales bacterium]